MRFDTERMKAYGFAVKGKSYILEKDFMDGDFTAVVIVHENGRVIGRVLDNMNEEEYLQLRMPNYTGSYVNTVRTAYEELLGDIAEHCCSEVAFASDQINRIAAVPLPDLDSADVMTTQYIPAPEIFLAGAIAALPLMRQPKL